MSIVLLTFLVFICICSDTSIEQELPDMEESRITIRIPPELHERLRVFAALKGKSINGLIVELLDQGATKEQIQKMTQEKFGE